MSDEIEVREPDQLAGVPLPESRTDVIGHAAARETIRAALDAARLPGGIMLHGPRGIGKATLAFDIAREVFTRTSDESPEHIAAQVAAGGYPNLRVLRKAPRDTGKGFYTAIRVEEVRGLIGESRMTRGRAGFRIVIVDSIDDCNPSSANALLKILEEPPPETLFLLVSHKPGGLLPTIKSRTQRVALRPLSDADVRQVLGDQPGVEHAVELAAGRPRRGFDALALGDNAGLTALQGWLRAPGNGAASVYLAVADALAADKDGAAFAFGREMLTDWIATEARNAANSGAKARLASATTLWDKATAAFADADEYNLDARQTLISLFDEIRRHAQTHLAPSARSMTRNAYYITTAIAYPNGEPHIGHAYEIIGTDAIARWRRLEGRDVFFLTGTDEHGIKMVQTAAPLGLTPRELADRNSARFREMAEKLNVSNTDFIRTTEERHIKSTQEIWRRMAAGNNGDIYQSTYKGWYSVRDEAYFDEDELTEGEGGKRFAPSGAEVKWVEEDSYFFRLSAYQDRLLKLYEDQPDFIAPAERRNEIISFVKRGLQDVSISRTTFDWGIPVPGAPGHVMYVWVDALTNYITGVGFPR